MKLMSVLFIAIASIAFHAEAAKTQKLIRRAPNQVAGFIPQVQMCPGTEALGNEGQGLAVSALLNVYSDVGQDAAPEAKKCELALAFAYEYGNDRGVKIGNISPFNVNVLSVGKTECVLTEKNGEILMTLKSSKSKKSPKLLVENCKLTTSGY